MQGKGLTLGCRILDVVDLEQKMADMAVARDESDREEVQEEESDDDLDTLNRVGSPQHPPQLDADMVCCEVAAAPSQQQTNESTSSHDSDNSDGESARLQLPAAVIVGSARYICWERRDPSKQ